MAESRVLWVGREFDNPYAARIEQFVGQEFPQLASGRTEDTMTAIVKEFFATRQYRIGPKPLPESEVMIRDVVRRAVEAQRPIPLLIALAAVKVPIGESLDLAELSMLRVLCALNKRIKQHYELGLAIRLRIEDLTEYAISGVGGDNVPDISMHVKHYSESMLRLIDALGYDFILGVQESSLADPEKFADLVTEYSDDFEALLAGKTNDNYMALLGWHGGVSPQMREWMYARYDRLYPSTVHGDEQQRRIMARYLSAILARRNLGAMGDDKSFKGRLEISFAPALPDTPAVSTRVYYRTVPISQSSLHMPPWLAKGYLRIGEDGVSGIALGKWDDEYTLGQLKIVGEDGKTASVRADYRLVP